MEYEAQAAILLEQAAARHIQMHGWPQPMRLGWIIDSDGRLDLLPLLASLVSEKDVELGAARFHATLAAALCEWIARAAQLFDVSKLAWGGGCFLNALLSARLRHNLEQHRIAVLATVRLSPDDSSIALGQAWVAMHSLEQ
jgi:hydrogenase maturation protein HypF